MSWDAPPKSDPPTVTPRQWLIDYDCRDNEKGVRIYELREIPGPRCVAKDVSREDAELIVSLYNEARKR